MAIFQTDRQLTLFDDRPTKPADRDETETEVSPETVAQILAQDASGWPTSTIAALWGLTERQVIDVRYRAMLDANLGPSDAELDEIFGRTPPVANEDSHKAPASDETNADDLGQAFGRTSDASRLDAIQGITAETA